MLASARGSREVDALFTKCSLQSFDFCQSYPIIFKDCHYAWRGFVLALVSLNGAQTAEAGPVLLPLILLQSPCNAQLLNVDQVLGTV